MRNTFIALGLSLLLTTVLSANDNNRTIYIGAGFGSSVYSDDKIIKEELGLSDLERTDVGYKLYTGYQINELLALELSYIDYGKFTASNNYSQSSSSFSTNANIGYSFFDNQIRPFGLIGLALVDSSFENIPSNTDVLDDRLVALHLGFGVEYTPKSLECISFRLATESDVYALDGKNSSGDKEDYGQALSLLYFSVQYNF